MSTTTIRLNPRGVEEIVVSISETSVEIGDFTVNGNLDLGEITIGNLVPVIPRNYGLITYNGSIITVS